jgi:hypothetical protein
MYPAFVRGTLTAGPEVLRVVGIPNHELVLRCTIHKRNVPIWSLTDLPSHHICPSDG